MLAQTLMFQPIIPNYRAYESNHLFNNPDNWESVPYNMNPRYQAGTELTATFNAVKSKAMRWKWIEKQIEWSCLD